MAMAQPVPTATPQSAPSPHPAIDLTWTTSLDGTVLTNPVRFPTHRGFVVLHITEHQADPKSGAPFTLSVAPHCVELARKTTSDEVIITPFNDGVCMLTVSDSSGMFATSQLYVGGQAISEYHQEATPTPVPAATPTVSPSPKAG